MNKKEAIEAINDKLKDLKYYAKEMGEVLKSTNYFIDELEKQAKKVEPKLKAYHVRDRYSYDCLMEELEEQGYEVVIGRKYDEKYQYICIKDNKVYRFGDCYTPKENYHIIEYHKEPKPKAWRVRDEYSLECLVQELQDQGFKYKSLTLEEHMEIKKEMLSRNGVTYIYVDEDNGINGFDKHYSLIDEYDLIEYKKEEPRFYAKIKGWELCSDNYYYWQFYAEEKELFADYKYESELYKTIFTKSEWNKLGINDSNADFEKAED